MFFRLPFILLLFAMLHAEENSVSRDFFPPSNTGRPQYLADYSDPVFGNRVTRIIADQGDVIEGTTVKWSRPARHIYSSVAAWDCSDSLLAIRNAGASKIDGSGAREWAFLDGETFQPVTFLNHTFTEFRWWNTKPKRMLLVTNEGLIDYDPVNDTSRVLEASIPLFNRYKEISLYSQGNLADDDSEIVLIGKSETPNTHHIILYSFSNEKVVLEFPLTIPHLDYATVSPKGTYIVANGEFIKGDADRTRIFDRNGKQVGEDWSPYGTPSHYDLAVDQSGREIAIGVAKSAIPGIPPGSVIARDLASGKITTLLTGGYPMHISTRNLKLPGWVFVSYGTIDPKTYPPFSNELVAVRTDGSGEFRRLCQFQKTGDDYWAQPQACPNTHGSLAVFATNWNEAARGAESAVVETGLRE